MCFKQKSFIFFLLWVIIQAQWCKRVSFNETDVIVYYSRATSPRNLRVHGCLSPFITVVENDFVGQLTNIISAVDQVIPILENEAIANFSDLRAVHMERNKIVTIKSGAFINLPELYDMNLNGNEIELLENDIFLNVPQLQYLNLNANRLFYFEQEWLGNVPNLKSLILDHNLIENIPKASFTSFRRLRYLYLAHNRILHVHVNAFDEPSRLKVLDLSYNRIKHLPNNVFVPTTELTHLNLYNNNLTYISTEVLKSFPQLEVLMVLYNPLTCPCYDKAIESAPKGSLSVDFTDSFFQCTKTEDLSNIPVCVVTDETECVMNTKEDLLSVLTSQAPDFECQMSYLDIEDLI